MLLVLLASCTGSKEPVPEPVQIVEEKPGTPYTPGTPATPPDNTGTKGTVVKDVSIQSKILDREMKYSLYLPAGYSEEKQYPVLYLLHGYGGDRDYFTYENQDFDKLLSSKGITHEHIERGGGHDWTFWSACSPKILSKAGSLFND